MDTEFLLLAIVENTAINIGMQISVQVSAFNSLGHILANEIVEPHGNLCLAL